MCVHVPFGTSSGSAATSMGTSTEGEPKGDRQSQDGEAESEVLPKFIILDESEDEESDGSHMPAIVEDADAGDSSKSDSEDDDILQSQTLTGTGEGTARERDANISMMRVRVCDVSAETLPSCVNNICNKKKGPLDKHMHCYERGLADIPWSYPLIGCLTVLVSTGG